jgi:hypothetical protein
VQGRDETRRDEGLLDFTATLWVWQTKRSEFGESEGSGRENCKWLWLSAKGTRIIRQNRHRLCKAWNWDGGTGLGLGPGLGLGQGPKSGEALARSVKILTN